MVLLVTMSTLTGPQVEYLYKNSAGEVLERLRALEKLEDAQSRGLLTKIGVSRGWSCLELGAGAGSVAQWLAERVGEDGRTMGEKDDVMQSKIRHEAPGEIRRYFHYNV